MEFTDCGAQDGGAIFLQNSHAAQDSGTLTFVDCQAGRSGGGLAFVKKSQLLQNNGSMSFKNCRASNGGGMNFRASRFRGIVQRNGSISFDSCVASLQGGGLSVSSGKIEVRSKLEFQGCSSGKGSGRGSEGHAELGLMKSSIGKNIQSA